MNDLHIETVKKWLNEHPGATLVANFQGAGDSGQVESVECLHDLYKVNPEIDSELIASMQEVTYAALEHQGLDWYNNEGGQGDVTAKLLKKGELRVICNTNINEMTSENHMQTVRESQLVRAE